MIKWNKPLSIMLTVVSFVVVATGCKAESVEEKPLVSIESIETAQAEENVVKTEEGSAETEESTEMRV